MKKSLLTIISIIIIAAGYFGFRVFNSKETGQNKPKETGQISYMTNKSNVFEIQGMKVEILKEGTGSQAKNGDTVSVHYTGTLENGTKFDSSLDRGEPFSFVLGSGQVIQGWDLGVLGMKIGEKRKLTIPYNLGYGELGNPPVIPAKATLIFEVEMIEIK